MTDMLRVWLLPEVAEAFDKEARDMRVLGLKGMIRGLAERHLNRSSLTVDMLSPSRDVPDGCFKRIPHPCLRCSVIFRQAYLDATAQQNILDTLKMAPGVVAVGFAAMDPEAMEKLSSRIIAALPPLAPEPPAPAGPRIFGSRGWQPGRQSIFCRKRAEP